MADVSIAKAQSMALASENLEPLELSRTLHTAFLLIKYSIHLIYFLQRFSRL
jgi:hypothetical protein